jgi:hypothetical protein
MTGVEGRFGFARMADKYRAVLFPAERHAMSGIELERFHGNLKRTARELD